MKFAKADLSYYLLALVVMVVLLMGGFMVGASMVEAEELPVQQVGNFFIDIDGNGTVDYVLRGEVIFNSLPLPVSPSEP